MKAHTGSDTAALPYTGTCEKLHFAISSNQ